MTGIHFLLTYMCNRACDHCFVFGAPEAAGIFTLDEICRILDDLPRIGTIETVYFEGGEPFLYYPVMVEGIRAARKLGFEAGIVTNVYWATSVEDAKVWLRPLAELGLSKLSISDDTLHYGEDEKVRSANAQAAAAELGIETSLLYTEPPSVATGEDGQPKVEGGVMFRGRAAEKLIDSLPTRLWKEFIECPAEKLDDPGRVHIDAYGNVHLCQGLLLGNVWKTPLSRLVAEYDPQKHPICGPLLRGGPAALVAELELPHEDEYVSECHLCYEARKALIDRFPEYLGPPQVYGL